MSRRRLTVLVDDDGGRPQLRAPAVGWWGEHPVEGALLGPKARVGCLRTIGGPIDLLLPADLAGRVTGVPERHGVLAVEFGGPLFGLEPIDAVAATGPGRKVGGGEGLPAGCSAVRSPTDGVFYQRPGPDEPPFVEVGRRIRRGQPVGLVEVMKTFNQIVFDAEGLPEEAEVVEIRAADGAEVTAGQLLIVVRG